MNDYRCNNKPGAAALVSRFARAVVIGLAVLCLVACPPEPDDEESLPISVITITNIPTKVSQKDTFKVYLNASNSMSDTDPPAAKGVKKIGQQQGSTYTVTIQLQNPNSPQQEDNPNLDTGNWSGTANFFSVVISPKGPTDKSEIEVRAGLTLDKSKAQISWTDLMKLESGLDPGGTRVQALWDRLIDKDSELKEP